MKNKKNPFSPAPRLFTAQKPYLLVRTPATATLGQLPHGIDFVALRAMVAEFSQKASTDMLPAFVTAKLVGKTISFYVVASDDVREACYEEAEQN